MAELMDADRESTDRYQALGISYPDPKTMCPGDCEGTGVVPVHRGDAKTNLAVIHTLEDERYRVAWELAEAANPSDDGYHFLPCADCGGTGLSKETE